MELSRSQYNERNGAYAKDIDAEAKRYPGADADYDGVPEDLRLEVITAIETPEEALLFLDKISEKNYQMTSEEVNEALMDTIAELN